MEIANCRAVLTEHQALLDAGLCDYDTVYPEFISKMKKAGSEKIIAEIQTQLESWLNK